MERILEQIPRFFAPGNITLLLESAGYTIGMTIIGCTIGFVLAFFLSGNQPTLPVYIWSQIRFPAKLPNVLALGSILLLTSVLLLVLAEYFRRRSSASEVR